VSYRNCNYVDVYHCVYAKEPSGKAVFCKTKPTTHLLSMDVVASHFALTSPV
jgi:hypothetical protein